MKYSLLFLVFFPLQALAQLQPLKDSVKMHRREKVKLESYVGGGYINELWVISSSLGNSVSSLSYAGKGGYGGIGFQSATSEARKVGFGLGLSYLQYTIDHSLLVNELAPTAYTFMKFDPSVCLRLHSDALFTVHLAATGSMLVPVTAKENNYYQLGGAVRIAYTAFELSIAYSFSNSAATPSSVITSKWREQMLIFGVAIYPSKLEQWGALKRKLKAKKKK